MSLVHLGNIADGEAAVRKSIEVKDDFATAWYDLGVITDEQGRPQEAEVAYRKTVEIDPEYFDAWSNLGVLFIETNRRDEAEAAFRKAIGQTRNILPWANLGLLLTQANRCKEAREILEEARKIAPMHERVISLGIIWLRRCAGY